MTAATIATADALRGCRDSLRGFGPTRIVYFNAEAKIADPVFK